MKLFVIAALALSIAFPTLSFAENLPSAKPAVSNEPQAEPTENPKPEAPAAANEETTEFSYGTVKSISENQVVVTEYDYDSDKDVETTYSVPATATFEGISKLSEIAVGDAIDIDYIVKDGQKIASVLSVEKTTPVSEEESALATDEESPKE